MATSRKTADEFASDLEEAITTRNSSYDTKVGPIPDLIIRPLANILELQNERIRSVQQLLALINDGSFTDSDVDSFVYNELLIRLKGSQSQATLIFSRITAPTIDLTIRANFPVATLSDEATGTSITFLTINDATMVAANASVYFNSTTQRYELSVVAEAVTSTSVGNVGPQRIVRPLRPLNGFDTVFNRDAASGGRDPETTDELIDRYFLSLIGTSPSVVNGTKKIIRDQYQSVEDSNVVFGNSPLNVRAAVDGGAVDVYIIGTVPVSSTENIIFPGVEQLIPLSKQPIISVSSVNSYIQGADYILVKDTGGTENSIRAQDSIKFLATGASPSIGSVLTVTYVYNGLIQQLQDGFTTDDRNVPGRDLLFKMADQIDITLSANLKIRSGFSISTVVASVSEIVLALINSSKLGADVEASDIQAVVRSFSSVDNFIITNLSKVGATGTSDIPIADNEFARLQPSDLIFTII